MIDQFFFVGRRGAVVAFGLIMVRSAVAAEAQHGESPSVFAGTFAQSIAATIVFLLLLFILWKSAWGRILQGLQDREDRIRRDLTDAQNAAHEADATLKQYQGKLLEAQGEAQQIIDRSRQDAERIAQQIKDDAQQQITQMRQRATADIRAAKELAVNEVYSDIAELSTTVAGRILHREISASDQQQLITESLEQLARTRN